MMWIIHYKIHIQFLCKGHKDTESMEHELNWVFSFKKRLHELFWSSRLVLTVTQLDPGSTWVYCLIKFMQIKPRLGASAHNITHKTPFGLVLFIAIATLVLNPASTHIGVWVGNDLGSTRIR